MANTKSAAKRARQTSRRTQSNRSIVTRLRTMQRKVRANPDATQVRELISAIDKAVKRGTIHRNAARRRKARFTRLLAKK